MQKHKSHNGKLPAVRSGMESKTMPFAQRLLALLSVLTLFLPSHAALAQETDISGRLSIELNAAQTADGACTLSFLIINGFDQPIEKVVFEAVLFDASGQVDRLTLFDFGALPPARPRVRQFVLPQVDCADLGRILFNGASTCDGINPALCETGLLPSSRTKIEVMG